MKNKISLIALALILILSACANPTPTTVFITATPSGIIITATPEPNPSATGDALPNTLTPTPTVEPSVTSSATIPYLTLAPTDNPDLGSTLTPSQIVPSLTIPATLPNRLPNPGMEEFTTVQVCGEGKCESHIVPTGYEPYYCDEHYMPEPCDALRIGTGNPVGLKMHRPEYKIAKASENPERVHSGDFAAQWFHFSRVGKSGLYVTVGTEPGEICEVGGWRQAWNNYKGDIQSENQTQDDRDNIMHRIKVNLDGKTGAYLEENLSSRWYGYDDFPYDTWGLVSYQFTANSARTTVFFESIVLFPVTNNDVYLDSVYMRCATP